MKMEGQARCSSHSEDQLITKLTKHFLTPQLNAFVAWAMKFYAVYYSDN